MSSQNKKKKYAGSQNLLQKPVYNGADSGAVEELSRQLQQRPAFSYDINTDALYQQYSRQYQDLGRGAMEDTMGIAQAMTGGYGNSYAQTAGQQTYQRYLAQLGDKLPQLYQQALERYQTEGDWLQSRYDAAKEQEQTDYDRYQDSLDSYYRELSYQQEKQQQDYERQQEQEQENYDRQQDLYDQVRYMMEHFGYYPSEENLVSLGLTPEQAKLLLGKL